MKKASWILLTIVGALMLLASLGSLFTAYRPAAPDALTPEITLDALTAGNPEAATALRARRGTAASFAAAYAVLFLFVVLGSYRHGDRWSWWALLCAALTLGVLTAARVPLLGTQAGVGASLTPLVIVVVALLLDVRRISGSGPA
jgi:hypothetical protein